MINFFGVFPTVFWRHIYIQSGPQCVSLFAQENTKSSDKSSPVLTFQISTDSVDLFASWPVADMACYNKSWKVFF